MLQEEAKNYLFQAESSTADVPCIPEFAKAQPLKHTQCIKVKSRPLKDVLFIVISFMSKQACYVFCVVASLIFSSHVLFLLHCFHLITSCYVFYFVFVSLHILHHFHLVTS